MSKLYFRNALVVMAFALPVAALADVTGTQTIPSGSTLNLDTNTIGTPASGDILWASGSITPEGSATAVDLTNLLGSSFSGTTGYALITSATISTLVGTGAGSVLSTTRFHP
jgi:hypothetical protein